MNLSALSDAGFMIQLHVLCAVLSALLGPVALLRRRRDRIHKTVGYVWVTAMALTALSSMFILELRVIGPFSQIHILSVVTLVGLWQSIAQIRLGNVKIHRRVMWRLYWQAIGIAGLFSFLPGRDMNALIAQIGG